MWGDEDILWVWAGGWHQPGLSLSLQSLSWGFAPPAWDDAPGESLEPRQGLAAAPGAPQLGER